MWVCFGMGSMGLLVGNLVGMSSDHLSRVILGLLFGLIGGSIAALLHKIPVNDRHLAGAALCTLSLGCLVGVYSGIFVSQYQLLTPASQRTYNSEAASAMSPKTGAADTRNYYLRGELRELFQSYWTPIRIITIHVTKPSSRSWPL